MDSMPRLAQADHLGCQVDGVHPGQAGPVQEGGRHGQRDAGVCGGPSGRNLSGAGGHHVPEVGEVHIASGDAGPIQGTADRSGTQVGGRQRGEPALEAAHRSACSGEDDYRGCC